MADLVFVYMLSAVFLAQNEAKLRDNKTVVSTNRVYAEQRLINTLLVNYDSDARGIRNVSDSIQVNISFILLRINDLNEKNQVLTTSGLILVDWRDERLRWDPTKYNNIRELVMNAKRVWLPEIALLNGADEMNPNFKRIRLKVSYDGLVHWEPGGVFQTTCDMNIRDFPFDEQTCEIIIGAWAYDSTRMNVTNATTDILVGNYRQNGEWHLSHTHAHWAVTVLPCCPDLPYSKIVFSITLRRRVIYYIVNILVPCGMLSVLVLIVFCLPPVSGEKISVGISVLLAFTVFLLLVADIIPRTSLQIPLMVIYLACTMALGTFSVCLTAFVLNVYHQEEKEALPYYVRIIMLEYLGRLLCSYSVKQRYSVITRDMSCEKYSVPLRSSRGSLPHISKQTSPCSLRMRECSSTLSRETSLPKIHNEASLYAHALMESKKRKTPNTDIEQTDIKADKELQEDSLSEESAIIEEWACLTIVLDRLFFCIVFIMMILSTVLIFLRPYYL